MTDKEDESFDEELKQKLIAHEAIAPETLWQRVSNEIQSANDPASFMELKAGLWERSQ